MLFSPNILFQCADQMKNCLAVIASISLLHQLTQKRVQVLAEKPEILGKPNFDFLKRFVLLAIDHRYTQGE
jgi:hypothetical protein